MNAKELTVKIEQLEATIAVLIQRAEASDAKLASLENWANEYVSWTESQLADLRKNADTTRVAVVAKAVTSSSRIRVLAPKQEYLQVKAEMIASGKTFTTQQVVDEALRRAKAAKPTE